MYTYIVKKLRVLAIRQILVYCAPALKQKCDNKYLIIGTQILKNTGTVKTVANIKQSILAIIRLYA